MPSNTILRLRITIYNEGMNNNNNNQTPLMQMRDRLFQIIFMRASIAYASVFPKAIRSLLENLVLLFAFFSLFVLAYTHVMFIQAPMNCLDFVAENWPRHGILRVEVMHKVPNKTYTLKDSYLKEAQIRQMQGYQVPHFNKEDFVTTTDSKNDEEAPNSDSSSLHSKAAASEANDLDYESFYEGIFNEEETSKFLEKSDESERISLMYKNPNHSSIADGDALSKTWHVLKVLKEDEFYEIKEAAFFEESYILEYSLEYGYLRHSPKTRERLNIPVQLATLDPTVDICFGNWFTKTLLEYFLGYDNILMASIRTLAEKEDNKGYIRNVVGDNYFRFVNIMNHLSYAYAAITMLVYTLSISMLLRYSHHQIFVFIVQLLRLFEFRGNTNVPAAPLLTVILALVGMEAIMSQFFTDPTTSFYVILIVWVADQYDAICCRTAVARRHWLRFFYLYHYAFYAYDYRFSGQYSDLALFTSCCFIFHSMVFFFHHYELPAILNAVQREAHQQHPDHSEPEPMPPEQGHVDPDFFEEPQIVDEPSVPEVGNVNQNGTISNDSNETSTGAASSSSQALEDFFNHKCVHRNVDHNQRSDVRMRRHVHLSSRCCEQHKEGGDAPRNSIPVSLNNSSLTRQNEPSNGGGAEGNASSSSLCQTKTAQCCPCSASHRNSQMSSFDTHLTTHHNVPYLFMLVE